MNRNSALPLAATAALATTAIVVTQPDGTATVEVRGVTYRLTDTTPMTIQDVALEAAEREAFDVAKLRPAWLASELGFESVSEMANYRADAVAVSQLIPQYARERKRGEYATNSEAKQALETEAATDDAQRRAVRAVLRSVKRALLDMLLTDGDGTPLRVDMCLSFRVQIPCAELQSRRPVVAGELCADVADTTIVEIERTVTAGVDGVDLPEWAQALNPSVREVDCANVTGELNLVRSDTTLAGNLVCTQNGQPSRSVSPTAANPVPRAVSYERLGYACACAPGGPCVTCPVSGGFLGFDPCVRRLERASE